VYRNVVVVGRRRRARGGVFVACIRWTVVVAAGVVGGHGVEIGGGGQRPSWRG